MALQAQRDNENDLITLAYRFIEESDTSIFLTGRAGTGKTTFLRYLQQHSNKRLVVAAPTGVAAINAGGVTLHSLFQLPFSPFLPTRYASTAMEDLNVMSDGELPPAPMIQRNGNTAQRKMAKEKIKMLRSLDLLIIDEISMVRADLLDAVDDVLRRYRNHSLPFGGVQLLMIGDLQQLPPVVKNEEWGLLNQYYNTPYFFASKALANTRWTTIELEKVYRQSDATFINILNEIRDNRIQQNSIERLNKCAQPGFAPSDDEHYIQLCSHNAKAQRINSERLAALSSGEYYYHAQCDGDYPEHLFPTDATLTLKEGAQVMFIKNDPSMEKLYYNGKIGIIESLDEENVTVFCPDYNMTIVVAAQMWENCKYTVNPETKAIEEEIIGSFLQIPLKLAWAITIHKSQGLTFERAIIDANDSFAHGQVYVALSRCKSLEGLVLTAPLQRRAIISDDTLAQFSQQLNDAPAPQSLLSEAINNYYLTLAAEQFDFTMLRRHYYTLRNLAQNYLSRIYTNQSNTWYEAVETISELSDIGNRFRQQLSQLGATSNDASADSHIQDRITKAASYFAERIERLRSLPHLARLDIDNKEGKKQIKEMMERFGTELYIKDKTLSLINANASFAIGAYLSTKNNAIFDAATAMGDAKRAKRTKKAALEIGLESDPNAEIPNTKLFEALRQWRLKEADSRNAPAYTILHQKPLVTICHTLPNSTKGLLQIKGIGKTFIERYADTILALIAANRDKE